MKIITLLYYIVDLIKLLSLPFKYLIEAVSSLILSLVKIIMTLTRKVIFILLYITKPVIKMILEHLIVIKNCFLIIFPRHIASYIRNQSYTEIMRNREERHDIISFKRNLLSKFLELENNKFINPLQNFLVAIVSLCTHIILSTFLLYFSIDYISQFKEDILNVILLSLPLQIIYFFYVRAIIDRILLYLFDIKRNSFFIDPCPPIINDTQKLIMKIITSVVVLGVALHIQTSENDSQNGLFQILLFPISIYLLTLEFVTSKNTDNNR